MSEYKYVGTEEQLKENGFVKINGFYFRDGNLIISKQNTVHGVGLGLKVINLICLTPKKTTISV